MTPKTSRINLKLYNRVLLYYYYREYGIMQIHRCNVAVLAPRSELGALATLFQNVFKILGVGAGKSRALLRNRQPVGGVLMVSLRTDSGIIKAVACLVFKASPNINRGYW